MLDFKGFKVLILMYKRREVWYVYEVNTARIEYYLFRIRAEYYDNRKNIQKNKV